MVIVIFKSNNSKDTERTIITGRGFFIRSTHTAFNSPNHHPPLYVKGFKCNNETKSKIVGLVLASHLADIVTKCNAMFLFHNTRMRKKKRKTSGPHKYQCTHKEGFMLKFHPIFHCNLIPTPPHMTHASPSPSIHSTVSLPCDPVLPYPSSSRQKRTHMQRVISS